MANFVDNFNLFEKFRNLKNSTREDEENNHEIKENETQPKNIHHYLQNSKFQKEPNQLFFKNNPSIKNNESTISTQSNHQSTTTTTLSLPCVPLSTISTHQCHFHHSFRTILLILCVFMLFVSHQCESMTSNNLTSFSSSSEQQHTKKFSSMSNVTDLIVNIGANVLLECTSPADSPSNPSQKTNFYDHNHADDDHENLIIEDHEIFDDITKHKESSVRRNGRYILSHTTAYKYIWCRYEEDWVQGVTGASSYRTDDLNSNDANEQEQQQHKQPFLRYKTCFEGDRYFVANENRISTVIYRCGTVRRDTGAVVGTRLWKLYVDQFATVYQKRDTTASLAATSPLPAAAVSIPAYAPPSQAALSRTCSPPRCKPYASVVRAHCNTIELNIRYPSNQYGYNRTRDHWGTIACADQIGGYQLWLIGYGVVKKFLPNDQIIMDNLIPGKRYCFNGWAYNACGAGPVFTLEGVCAKNTEDCHGGSDEHCELDVDYSY